MIGQLIYKIKRIIDFIPILWKSHDFDYVYSIDLFKYQLERTAKHIELHGVTEDKKHTINRIKTAIRLLDKVYNEEYVNDYLDVIESKYGKGAFKLTPSENNTYKIEIESEEIKKEIYQLTLNSLAKQNKAHRILWNFIEWNIRNWWD